ncbi:MAG: valine--tRNA ligase [Thermoplasmata archaeon]
MSPTELPSRFEPGAIEARWQRAWGERGLFTAPPRPTGPAYTIVLPPPNVTGTLTLGHLLGGTVMDLLCRWHRMRGDAVLWLPGVDHAGLATQVEVRKRLAKQGVALDRLPREEIVGRVETWKLEHEARIREQFGAAGFGVDPARYRYTMDPGFLRATRHAFVRLHREGLIYRGERIVNWDPKLKTAVSDLEVVRSEEPARLLRLTYPFDDGRPGGIAVATVRPETIFGDIAVAVHPDDPRHQAVLGRTVRVPLTERSVPIISDPLVDPNFGAGALKVTPMHDPVDFQIARRHPELPRPPPVLDPGGHLAGDWVPERFKGLDREAARRAVTDELRAGGFLEGETDYVHAVARSERSEAVIEPTVSMQWFVRTPALAGPAVEAVRRGEIRLHPERWELTFFRWMESLEDWCISRQIAWGHPIPVLYCERCGAEIVEEEPPAACPKCGSERLRPDPDVLDTWFSSWLWPFAALGWPEPAADLAHYFPTSTLVTGRDIMFFWVARMMMASYHFTGRPPFSDVYFTGMLRDDRGRRMSKHLGNSPDPAVLIGAWGADPVRFALLFPNPTDQDGPFKEVNLEGARNFLTKLWNLVRLLAGQLPDGSAPPAEAPALGPEAPLADRWILSRWHRAAREVDAALAAFEFTRAAGLLRDFLWHDVADRYVELAKEALTGRTGETAARRARGVLLFVLERSLRQLHPMVPHVTEELWHALPHVGESLGEAPWPRPEEAALDASAEAEMEVVLEAIRGLRLLRSENGVPAPARPPAWIRPTEGPGGELLRRESVSVARLAWAGSVSLLDPTESAPADSLASVSAVGELYLARPATATSSDWESLLREKEKLAGLVAKGRDRLRDPGFRSRAPPEVVAAAEAKVAELTERIRRIDEHLAGPRDPPTEGT